MLFSDYSGPEISFSSQTKSKNDQLSPFDIDDSKNVETVDSSTNTEKKETQEESIQLNMKDLLTNELNKNYDEKKLEEFLNRAYVLVNDALLLRRDERFETLDDEDLNNQNFSSNILIKFPSLIVNEENKKYKISDMTFSHNGTILAVSFYIDQHIGPCSHSGLINFYKFDNLNKIIQKNENKNQENEENEKNQEEDNNNNNTNINNNNNDIITNYTSKISIETHSCIRCIDAHPLINNIFIAGSYNGEIYYINIGNENGKDYIEHISKIDSMLYKECIISLKFIKYEENIYYIISINQEGRILLWNPSDQLKYPVIGFNLKFKILGNILPINPTCFIPNPFENFEYLLGTYDGNIYKCQFNKPNEDSCRDQDIIFLEKNGVVWRQKLRIFISKMQEKELTKMKNYIEKLCQDRDIFNLDMEEFFDLRYDVNKIYRNCLTANFEKHFSLLTSISCNSFIKNFFLTTSYDGTLRLYKSEMKGANYFYSQHCNNDNDKNNNDNYCYFTNACWSPYKPTLFVSGNSQGQVNFNIITSRNVVKNVLSINNNGNQCSVKKILFNPNESYNNIMAICYSDGIIELVKLSDSFSNVGNSEIERLIKISSN